MKVDLKHCAKEALETAKTDLCRDGYLDPVAFIVTGHGILDFNLDYGDEEQKVQPIATSLKLRENKQAPRLLP